MASSRACWLRLVGLAFLAACASAPPGGGEAQRRPVERVVVAAHFEPRIEWEIKADRNYAGRNYVGESVLGAIRCGPLVVICLPVGALVGAIASAASGIRAHSAGKGDAQESGVRGIDLSGLTSALDLQSRLQHVVAGAGWKVQEADGDASEALRLEAHVERVKALSSAPVRNLWVHEMEVSWRLVDPADSGTVASGGFRYEKVLSFSLRYDEASGEWVGEDDGRFAAAWAQACEEMAARIALEAGPAIAAYGR